MHDLIEEKSSPVINPVMLTLQEYFKLVNPSNKYHEDHAYDLSLERLNGYASDKAEYPKLLRRLRVNGLDFEVRISTETNKHDQLIAIFNDENKRVAGVQDEWGCVLIMVAREYRGFGFGPLLGKIARTIEPTKQSGGFTPSGYRNFVKVHREMVRDALKSGFYAKEVRAGRISIERVKEIVNSAMLQMRSVPKERNLAYNNPKDWLLYVGGYGDFVLYDRKLKDRLEDDSTEDEYWVERMIKGVMLAREFHGNGIVVQFGGDTTKIKTFMITCAISYCSTESIPFYVDPDDRQFVDPKYGSVADQPDHTTGYKRYLVTPVDTIDVDAFGSLEKRFRKSFDQYDEFKHRMLELGFSKFRTPNA